MIEFIDKSSTNEGTPLNRVNMMAIQGFESKNTKFNKTNGKIVSIEETNSNGETKTTTFNEDGTITEVFSGEKVITKTTTFNEDDTISEVISYELDRNQTRVK